MEVHLHTFGARLRVKDGLFQITKPDLSGANHHIEEEYAAHQVKTVLLEKGTSVSTDALLLALQNGTDILVLDHHSHPVGRIWQTQPNSTTEIWKAQLALSGTVEGLRIAREWICEKLQHQVEFLKKLRSYRKGEKRENIEHTITEINDYYVKIKQLRLTDAQADAATIRGWEGNACKLFYSTLSQLLPDEYQFEGRSRRPAEDAFNAFLNYGYGILYRIVEKALLQAGIHPHIGLMHADRNQRMTMVYDFIESCRIAVDRVVYRLFTKKIATEQHIKPAPSVATAGIPPVGWWLNESGKRAIVMEFAVWVQEKDFEYAGKVFSFETLLREKVIRSAQQFRQYHFEKNRLVSITAPPVFSFN